MTWMVRTSLIAVAIAISSASYGAAEEPAPQLRLQTADGQMTYRMGERIPLALSFTGPGGERFRITTSSNDNGGRAACETFEVTPSSGWADPLTKYFGSGTGLVGGGLSGIGYLSEKPLVIPLNLNEWVRFDSPGTYKLTVVSHRVTDTQPRPSNATSQEVPLKSNSIDLKILAATPAWQRAKLASVVEELRVIPTTQMMQTQPPMRTAAIADLRFLATSAAAKVMAQHLREDELDAEFQCALGLAGLPDSLHADGITALKERIADPEFPVSSWFLMVMPLLQLSEGSAETQVEERQRLYDSAWAAVLAALPAKKGAARAATAQVLLSRLPEDLTSQMKANLGGVLAASFKDLPPDRQAPELEYNWDLLRSADMLPTLEGLATLPLENPGSNESNTYTRRELKSAALERWYELDPEGARQEAMRQVGSMHPSLTDGSLAFLKDAKLPQFETMWADAFMAADDYEKETVLLSLMTRFGTGSAVSLVQGKTSEKLGKWACAAQAAALGYLLKFDAEAARPLIERAVAERGEGATRCYQQSFQEISRYATGPVLTAVAVQALDDSDPQVTLDALLYLIPYGDKSVQQPIWNRYVTWSDKWRGRGAALEAPDAGSTGNGAEGALGQNLAIALTGNQGWHADADLISRVLARCVGEQMCAQLQSTVENARPPYSVSATHYGDNEDYRVAQYSPKSLPLLEEKIAQYPCGTKFALIPTSPQTGDQIALEAEVKNIFEKNGMTLEAPSPMPPSK